MVKKRQDIELALLEALEKRTLKEREAYLDQVCGDDVEVRAELNSLLESCDQAGGFLEIPPMGQNVTLDESPFIEGPGTTIDRYKLLEKIGEGGMAVVYMAEQQEPIRRKVALKIIKLGMDTKSVIARFEAERQALAMMDHPNIAKVLDAGATEMGRPYFVMELVKGTSITDFCDANNLSTHERLKLFVQVCQAVQHAHQKRIIHRDIKPTNVMVTLHDGVPVPKVIDFGIAKAINRQLTEKTLFTRYAQMIGTPAYMSPEQAEMSGLDIDTRTDVYSLGTLLYELLTGSPPFTSEYLLRKSYEEMQRIIREEEPTRPSTMISTLGKARIDVAKRRATNPDVLQKLIRADLDWIVMKTLEKDRNRRYDSVSEFAADIKRYLNDEPVLAGPPSTTYRFKKFIRRHRTLVTASSAVALVIIVGLIISTSLYLRMNQALKTVSQLEGKVDIYNKLSTVQRLYTEGRYQAALDEIDAMLNKEHLGPEAHLLRARLLVEVGQIETAEAQLLPLTKAESDIAGAAYYLLARIKISINDPNAAKYEALAASIHPETAEAYALRAMTASSPKEALQWLDRAISLDPTHYPARMARVLIHYTQGQNQKMVEDVAALIALRPADSIGYTLRAILRRESSRFEEALEDHARAMELCESQEELIQVYDQQYKTHTKMGDHFASLNDARHLVELDPNNFDHRLNIVTSLLFIKDFSAVQREYRSIVQTSFDWDNNIRRFLIQKAFDMFIGGQTLEIPSEIAQKAPFVRIQRAIDAYHALSSKATYFPLPRQGVVAYAWSPDSKQLLCGWSGTYGTLQHLIKGAVPVIAINLGLKIIDIESGEERLIAKKHSGIPAWSPDGRYIAFPDEDSNLYVVPVEGGQSRKVASGKWPHWSSDSQRLYFNKNKKIRYININEPDPIPQTLMKCPGNFAICEAENWIATGKPTGIELMDLSTGSVFYRCPSPWAQNSWGLNLSPDGSELSFFCPYPHIPIDPLILDIHHKRLYRVFAYPIWKFLLSPDGSKLAIGASYRIWIMETDPNLTISQSLGQWVSEGELIPGEIEKQSEAIAADPLYPENYLRRAIAYMSLDQFDKAEADLEQFDVLVTKDDHHVGYEIFWWITRCYSNELVEEAKFLLPYAESLMNRFPAEVPSYRELIVKIIEKIESNDEPELAERWRGKLQELGRR